LLKQTEGRIDPFSRIPKKDCWQQVETLAPFQINAGRVELGRGFENRVFYGRVPYH